MLKTRMKRIADHHATTARTIARIEASVVALSDEDLLDLADIFAGEPATPLADMAGVEMAKRGLSL
ncbi:hypothetical protein ACQKJZ_02560 [Sphingomonas sp. NPDC019816]|uniref:hypothetical protein n=1 Tax=unclassified Sphingomonas TaxID=196159 RepID=UPI0028A03141|nr:hypothetical protein [Sphingomonas sp.]